MITRTVRSQPLYVCVAKCSQQLRQRCNSGNAHASLTEANTAARDLQYMQLALQHAEIAASLNEVPVGAVLVDGDRVLAACHNSVEVQHNPTAHAEILAITTACQQMEAWRLLDCTLYVTLEPCVMCAGAILQARVGTLVYGAPNTLLGADGTFVDLLRPSEAALQQQHTNQRRNKRQKVSPGTQLQCPTCLQPLPHSHSQQVRANRSRATGNSSFDMDSGVDEATEQAGPSQGTVRGPREPHPFHRSLVVRRGVMAEECAEVMRRFFRRRRLEEQERWPSEKRKKKKEGEEKKNERMEERRCTM